MQAELIDKINQKYNHNLYKRKHLNILIIDDDEMGSTVLKECLLLRGHNVEIVNEGTRGITKNITNNYNIVFIDYHLDNDIPPNINIKNVREENILNGASVSEILNININKNRDKYLIFGYTGDSTNCAINKFKKSGADGVIIKPIEHTILDKLMFNIESNIEFDKQSLSKAFKSNQKNVIIF